MSIKLSKDSLYFKDKTTGSLLPVGVVASGSDESLAAIKEYADNATSSVQAAIQAKGDTVLASIPEEYSELSSDISKLKQENATMSARMDTFTALEEGSTTGDAELTDIRIGADGTTYATAGDAVRGQVNELKEDLSLKANQTSLNATNAKVQNLIDINKGVTYKEVVDSSLAQTKDVATDSASTLTYTEGVAPYASVDMIGGMTRKAKNLLGNFASRTQNGLTFTPFDNGSGLTITGTATADFTVWGLCSASILASEACIITNYGSGNVGCMSYQDVDHTKIAYAFLKANAENSVSCYGISNLYASFTSGETYSLTFNVQLETGSTATDFEPYSDHLLDAPVDKVTSIGKNLLSDKGIVNGANYGTISSCSNNVITLTPTINWAYGNYTFYGKTGLYIHFMLVSTTDTGYLGAVYEMSGINHNFSSIGETITLQLTSDSIRYFLRCSNSTTLSTIVMKVWVTTEQNAEYEDYIEIEKSIPSTITDLCPDYGIGINESYYNYIDWQNKKYIQNVGKVDLGTLPWELVSTYWYRTSFAMMAVANTRKLKILCEKYVEKVNGETWDSTWDKVIFNSAGELTIGDSDYTEDATALKESLSGVYLCYPLKVPIDVDLSSVIDDDFSLLEVEGGGTLSFHYPEQDNGYDIDMPSSITYDVDISQFSE